MNGRIVESEETAPGCLSSRRSDVMSREGRWFWPSVKRSKRLAGGVG
ncbi:hypothetical protein NPIL_66731, partial [Nephila pilipes]